MSQNQHYIIGCYRCSKPIETRDFIELNCCGKKAICKGCEPLLRDIYGKPLLGHDHPFISCPECGSFEPVPWLLAMQLISRNYVPRNFQEIADMTPEEKDSVQPYIQDLEKRQERLQRLIREEKDAIEAMVEEIEASIYHERCLNQR
jgi:hypothetical protein